MQDKPLEYSGQVETIYKNYLWLKNLKTAAFHCGDHLLL